MARSLFSKYAVYLVPAIMVFFFARNLVLTNTSHMDAWMGGAFRMFSSVDKMLYRVAGFTAEADGKTYFVNLRNIETMASDDSYLKVMPADARLKKIMDKVRTMKWCRDSISGNIVPFNGQKKGVSPFSKFDVKSIAVYKPVFDKDANSISLSKLNEYPAR